ncbi:MAG TPA: T9SS type A sorting domain-containing protein [Chitinophagaceae bacterium]|nr:T9SS type A sorting domain-containing protein [Chitinophagaceae bacterium]
MKIILPLISILIFPLFVSSQITSPVVRANFGVDGELRANFFNGSIINGNDDWFHNNGTPGEGIIDTTGAAFILNRYAIDPNFRRISFFRGMRFPQFSIVNNSLLIDGIFIRDYHGDDSTVFASGSNKNGMSPASWSCPESQGVPDKNEILDVLMHVRRAGPGGTDSLWLFGGVSIENTTGNRYFDFEMYQTNIFYDRNSLAFSGYGPDAGHTSWEFDASGNILKAGDIIFTAEFGTSGLNLVEARIWINEADLSLTPSAFQWGGDFDGDGNGATYGYANILPKTTGAFYTGLASPTNTWAGPFQLVLGDNSLVTDYTAKQFMEFSVNLSKLGLDPYITSNDICGMPFRKILIKSRASTSFTSELKDFVGPFDFFRGARAEAAAQIPFFCGTSGVTDINVINVLPTSIYKWTTVDGHIISDSVGPTITVDRPGTYIVRQELMDNCSSAYAQDTVVVWVDSICLILKTNILNFSARKEGSLTELHWSTTANKSTAYFQIERSLDNLSFNQIGELKRQGEQETGSYSFRDTISILRRLPVFYRLKIIDVNGNYSYSKVVALSSVPDAPTRFIITPNPVQSQAQLLFVSSDIANLKIEVFNNSGRLVHSVSRHVNIGTSIISFPEAQSWPNGIYLIRAMVGETALTQKMIVSH